ncbi:MAG: trehalase family glycosidase [Armatimonadota bacterium]|nr:trehalase family glycosidase [Armatimonadota bacterium]
MNLPRTRLGAVLLLLFLSATLSAAGPPRSNKMTRSFIDTLKGKLRFESSHLAFCPHYSWFGVSKREKLGIEDLWLYYSRASPLLSSQFLTFEVGRGSDVSGKTKTRSDFALEIQEQGEHGFSGVIAFADLDIVCYHLKADPAAGASGVKATMSIPATEPKLKRRVAYDPNTRLLTLETRFPRVDGRDPDPDHPLAICVIVPEAFSLSGGLTAETDEAVQVSWTARADALAAEQTFIVGIGEGETAAGIKSRTLRLAGIGSRDSRAASKRWLAKALDKFTFDGVPTNMRLHYAKSAYQILSNTKAPRGRLKHAACYPGRGVYAAQFLWDACFTSVGAALFNQKLAEGYLLNIYENQEADGKMPQFVCATWNRPGETQSPLVGWAAWRLYEQFGNKKLVSAVYGPLGRMVEWWFKNRDQDGNGVCEYMGGFECWDDSPRFDKGRIEGVDLNAYLNRDMRILAKMAKLLGKQEEAEAWKRRADRHYARMFVELLDPHEEIFYDRLVDQKTFHKILTPASFTPLWAGMAMPKDVARRMIRQYLLDPNRLFGKYPFPTVAYDDPTYKPDSWWRGPVWPNIAWIMVETLEAYGFEKEGKVATNRLLDMMMRHDELYELYSSRSGDPSGCPGYGWTCAVFMDLARKSSRD